MVLVAIDLFFTLVPVPGVFSIFFHYYRTCPRSLTLLEVKLTRVVWVEDIEQESSLSEMRAMDMVVGGVEVDMDKVE